MALAHWEREGPDAVRRWEGEGALFWVDEAVEKSSKEFSALIAGAVGKTTRPHPARLRLATLSRRAREPTSPPPHLTGQPWVKPGDDKLGWSRHLGVFEKAIAANVYLLDELGALPGLSNRKERIPV